MTTIQIIPKQHLKTRTNFDMIEVKQIGKYDYDVINVKNKHKHIVRMNETLYALMCDCMYGTQESSRITHAEQIDEGNRCIHIRAVRNFIYETELRKK